jgi:FixJ family two-component response regulator
MIMPHEPSGGKLAQILRAIDPTLSVIYITGYGSEVVREELPDTLKPGVNFLSKPFDPHALLKAVRISLAGPDQPESSPVLALA